MGGRSLWLGQNNDGEHESCYHNVTVYPLVCFWVLTCRLFVQGLDSGGEDPHVQPPGAAEDHWRRGRARDRYGGSQAEYAIRRGLPRVAAYH